MIEISED